jgi:hypothetical protein
MTKDAISSCADMSFRDEILRCPRPLHDQLVNVFTVKLFTPVEIKLLVESLAHFVICFDKRIRAVQRLALSLVGPPHVFASW